MLFDLVIELALKVIFLLNLCLFLRRCQVSLLSQLLLNLVLSLPVSYDIFKSNGLTSPLLSEYLPTTFLHMVFLFLKLLFKFNILGLLSWLNLLKVVLTYLFSVLYQYLFVSVVLLDSFFRLLPPNGSLYLCF